ncbi:MAG: NUDIX domain-containing protein [Bacteroidales bacterium]
MQEAEIKHFTVRVYALIINPDKEILVSDEYQMNSFMTKFPGGGLEFGEGTLDCLKREAMEEFGQEIEILSHFYTTDFFQRALYLDGYQVINVYYKARFLNQIQFPCSSRPFDFKEFVNGSQSFRWLALKDIQPEGFTLPIDKYVAKLLKIKFEANEI